MTTRPAPSAKKPRVERLEDSLRCAAHNDDEETLRALMPRTDVALRHRMLDECIEEDHYLAARLIVETFDFLDEETFQLILYFVPETAWDAYSYPFLKAICARIAVTELKSYKTLAFALRCVDRVKQLDVNKFRVSLLEKMLALQNNGART